MRDVESEQPLNNCFFFSFLCSALNGEKGETNSNLNYQTNTLTKTRIDHCVSVKMPLP